MAEHQEKVNTAAEVSHEELQGVFFLSFRRERHGCAASQGILSFSSTTDSSLETLIDSPTHRNHNLHSQACTGLILVFK